MTINFLLTGKLHGKPEQRIGKPGRPFTTAKLRMAAGDGDGVLFVNVAVFNEPARVALLGLEVGDAVALAGDTTFKAWTDKGGTTRPSVDLVVRQVLTAYAL